MCVRTRFDQESTLRRSTRSYMSACVFARERVCVCVWMDKESESRTLFQQAFNEIDTDASKTISLAEFLKYVFFAPLASFPATVPACLRARRRSDKA